MNANHWLIQAHAENCSEMVNKHLSTLHKRTANLMQFVNDFVNQNQSASKMLLQTPNKKPRISDLNISPILDVSALASVNVAFNLVPQKNAPISLNLSPVIQPLPVSNIVLPDHERVMDSILDFNGKRKAKSKISSTSTAPVIIEPEKLEIVKEVVEPMQTDNQTVQDYTLETIDDSMISQVEPEQTDLNVSSNSLLINESIEESFYSVDQTNKSMIDQDDSKMIQDDESRVSLFQNTPLDQFDDKSIEETPKQIRNFSLNEHPIINNPDFETPVPEKSEKKQEIVGQSNMVFFISSRLY